VCPQGSEVGIALLSAESFWNHLAPPVDPLSRNMSLHPVLYSYSLRTTDIMPIALRQSDFG
jgi:hypothetical protein